jgi:phage/plasmid-associated DNA primase
MEQKILSGSEVVSLFTALSPNEKAEIVCKTLISSVFIHDGHLYVLQKTGIYQIQPLTKNKICLFVSQLVTKSYNKIDEASKRILEDRFESRKKFMAFITRKCSNEEISSYEPQIHEYLTRNDVRPDSNEWELHFRNGYLDLRTHTFKQRDPSTNIVTYCIDRDYVQSTQEQRQEVMKHISMIYPKEDFKYIVYCIGKCLIGNPSLDQDSLFLMGDASSGKSFIMCLTQSALGGEQGYVIQLQSNTFEANNPKRDKILNSFAENKHTLICWVNEFSNRKIASDDFKNFCDGTVITTRLYKDGSLYIKLKCKLIATTNLMPNMTIDTGLIRRFLAYHHDSKFTQKVSEVDPAKRIFLKDPELMTKLARAKLLDAWVDILAAACKDINDGNIPKITKNFSNTTETVVETNDIIQDFIDAKLKKTDKDEDRIGKNDMKRLFDEMYPGKHLSIQQLISSFKEKKIHYKCQYRYENVKGCFIGVKLKTDEDTHDIVETVPKITFIEPEEPNSDTNDKYKEQLTEKDKEISYLKQTNDQYIKIIEQLREDIKLLKSKKNKKILVKAKPKPKPQDVTETETVKYPEVDDIIAPMDEDIIQKDEEEELDDRDHFSVLDELYPLETACHNH